MGSPLALIGTITASATLMQAANGLLQVLLPLRMQAEGLSVTVIGLVATAYGFGFALGCFLAPAFIRHVGHIRAFASLAAVAAALALGMTQADSAAAWIVLRLLTGAIFAGLHTVIDGWVSARATSSHRGRLLSFYAVCTKVVLMLSPLGIALGSVEADGLFMVVSALISLCLLPVAATVTDEPSAPRQVRIDLPGLFRAAPSAIVGAFIVGLVNAPVMAITPVYGVAIGLTRDEAAVLIVALQAGSLVLQWPLGWLSDHADRRKVIAGLAAGTALVSLAILATSRLGSAPLVIGAFAVWGGLALCVYSVCVAHACDVVEPDRIVSTIASLLVSWAAGSTIGPALAAAVMDRFGSGSLFVYASVLSSVLAIFVVIRIFSLTRRPAKGGFVDLPPTSPVTGALSPRAEPNPRP